MPRPVALVSDSTSVDAELAKRLDVIVVPLQVIIGAKAYDEGPDASPELVAAALKRHTPVSTSRPAPAAFLQVYETSGECGRTGRGVGSPLE
ncbi:MAG: DegV family protein [Nocardioidaceae bacterium]